MGDFLKLLVAIWGAILTHILDWNQALLFLLVFMIILDTVLWLIVASKWKWISARGFAKWIKKLIVYFMLLLISVWLDWSLSEFTNMFAENSRFFLFLAIGWEFITESISVLEHMEKLWLPVPDSWLRILKVRKEKLEDKAEE